jgi:hypothetical protein
LDQGCHWPYRYQATELEFQDIIVGFPTVERTSLFHQIPYPLQIPRSLLYHGYSGLLSGGRGVKRRECNADYLFTSTVCHLRMLGSSLLIIMVIISTIHIAVVGFMARSYKFQNCLGLSIVVSVALILTASTVDIRTLTVDSSPSQLFKTDCSSCIFSLISLQIYCQLSILLKTELILLLKTINPRSGLKNILMLLISGTAFI